MNNNENPQRTIPCSVTCSALALVLGAYAGDGSAQPVTLAPINVEETLPQRLEDTPGAASVLTDEDIESFRPYTLHDAFDVVPGVRTIDDDVLGLRSGIGIRGAPSRRSRKVLLLEDGVPINASTYLDPSAHYTPPMERLESIEVLKGTGHVLHGPLNNHGIINFRNKRPTSAPETTVELGAGNLDTFKRHAMHTRTDGRLGTVFSYTGMDADGSFDVEEFSWDDFFVSFDYELNESHDIGLSITYFRERSDYDESNLTPIEYDLAPRRKLGRFGQEYNNFNLDYYKYDLTHNWWVSDRFSVSNKLFATDLDRARFTVEPEEIEVDALPDFVYEDDAYRFVPGVSGVMIGRVRQYNTYGAESRMQLTGLGSGNTEHALQWGLRAERHFLDNREPFGDIGEILNNNNRGHFSGENALEAASLEKFQATAVSGFFQDAMRTGHWTVTPGVRVEYYTQKEDVLLDDNEPGDGPEKDSNTLVLPSISALYDGFENTQWFGSIGRGYTPAFARTAEEFPLEPETGINTQVGFRTTAWRGFAVEGALFYNHIEDTVVQLPYTIDDRNVVLNSEDSRSYGVDVGVRFDSSALTGSAYNFFGELAYSYVNAEFTDGEVDGNRVPEIPENAGSITLGVEHTAGWKASATLSHFGSFYTDPTNVRSRTLADEDREPVGPGDELEIREPAVLGLVPSHTLLSARASYALPHAPVTLWVQGRNLTDKQYITDFENGIRPGAERTYVAGVTVLF